MLIFFFPPSLFLCSDVIMVNCLFMLLQLLALTDITDIWYTCCLHSLNSVIIFVVAGLLGKEICYFFFLHCTCLKCCFYVLLVVSHPFVWGRMEGGGFEDKAPVAVALFSEQVWSAAFVWLPICSCLCCSAQSLFSFGEKWQRCCVHPRLPQSVCEVSAHTTSRCFSLSI